MTTPSDNPHVDPILLERLSRDVLKLHRRDRAKEIADWYASREMPRDPMSSEELKQAFAASKAEVERLTGRMKEAEDLIKGLHGGWKKARKAHLATCKNAQAEIDKLHTENVCLQELIQEFYEWTRRDYPTEQEVREIMNRYHDLLNK